MLVAAGCATKNPTVSMNINASQASSGAADAKNMAATAGFGLFEDTRADKSRIGVRHHLWGGETPYDVPGSKAGDVVSRVMSEFLKRKGWTKDAGGSPDVTFSGKILSFSADAESKVFSTEITAFTKVVVEATNNVDGSMVRMTVNGHGRQRVFWYDDEDMQALLGETLNKSLEELAGATKVEGRMIRLK